MTLNDLINSVDYGIQGNVVIKMADSVDGDVIVVHEELNGGGILGGEVPDFLDCEVNYIYADVVEGRYGSVPVLVIEVESN